MSMLETLYFVFKGDTTDAEKALMRVDGKAKEAEGSIGKLIKQGAGMIGGFFAVGAIAGKLHEAAEQMNNTREAAERLGVSAGKLDLMQRVMEDAGGSADSFRGSLNSLQSNMEMFRTKGTSRAHDFFAEMGINEGSYANAMELVTDPKLANAFQKMTAAQAVAMGGKMGIDEHTVSLLRQGSEEFNKAIEAQKKFGELTEDQVKQIAEYDNASEDLSKTFMMLWRALAIAVIPAFKKVTEVLRDGAFFVKDHKQLFVGLGIAVGIFFGARMVMQVMMFVKALNAWRVAAMMAGAAQYAAMLPLILTIAAVLAVAAAFALMWEDIQAWQNGQPSIMGDLLGDWETFSLRLGDIFESIGKAWDKMIEGIVVTAEWLTKLIKNPIDTLGEVGSDIGSYLADQKEINDAAKAREQEAQSAPQNKMPNGSATAGMDAAYGNPTTQNKTVNTGDIIVNANGADSATVGTAVKDAIAQHVNDAIANGDNGVMA